MISFILSIVLFKTKLHNNYEINWKIINSLIKIQKKNPNRAEEQNFVTKKLQERQIIRQFWIGLKGRKTQTQLQSKRHL